MAFETQTEGEILFSLMKGDGAQAWPTEGVFQLGATPGEAVFDEGGDVEASVVIEDGEEEQGGVGGLSAASYGFWWRVKRNGSEVYRLNDTGRRSFQVSAGDRLSFSLDGSRGSKRAVLSYSFAPSRAGVAPAAGGPAAASVSASVSVSSSVRALSASASVGLSGVPRDPRYLEYQWQYAEQGSEEWTDLPSGGLDALGARSATLYLSRQYSNQNPLRRHRVVVSSTYYSMLPVASAEVAGPGGPMAELPGRPRILSVDPNESRVELSWSSAFDGFSSVTDYVVQYKAYDRYIPQSWVTVSRSASAATSFVVTGLADGTSYIFRVAAVNAVGQGLYSSDSEYPFGYARPGTVPEAPVLLSAVAGVGLVQLSWSPAASYAGSSYEIEVSTNGATWSRLSSGNTEDWPQGATSATLRSLEGGTGYSFRVLAYGTSSKPSPPSNAISATPTSAAPYPPASLAVYGYYSDRSVPADGVAEENLGLYWADDPRYPGTPKTGQAAQYSLDGGATWTPIQSNTPYAPFNVEVVNFPSILPRNTSFLFRAATINSVGQSAWSEPKAGTTPPGMVTGLAATRGQSSVTLSWTAPSGGNAQIVDYLVGVRPGAQVGFDLWSVDSGSRIVNNTGSATSISISRLTATSAVVNNLTAGRLYFFYIYAVNSGRTTNAPYLVSVAGIGRGIDYGPPRVTPYLSSPPGLPGAPTGLSGVPGVVYSMGSNVDPDSVSLGWTKPASDGGMEVTGYAIQYSGDGGSTWTSSGDYMDIEYCLACPQSREVRPLSPPALTTAKVKGLTLMQPYRFRVAAINEVGTGPYTAASPAVTPTKLPLGPEGFAAVPGNGSVSLSWTARTVDSERLPVTGYNVWYQTSGYWSNVVNNTGTYNPPGPWLKFNGSTPIAGTSANVTGLTNGKSYNFRVHAVNAGGEGFSSSVITVVPTAG